jgi:hypothetical protein
MNSIGPYLPFQRKNISISIGDRLNKGKYRKRKEVSIYKRNSRSKKKALFRTKAS